jgi:hypothetical protein
MGKTESYCLSLRIITIRLVKVRKGSSGEFSQYQTNAKRMQAPEKAKVTRLVTRRVLLETAVARGLHRLWV